MVFKRNLKGLSGINPSYLGYFLAKEAQKELEELTIFAVFPDEELAKDFWTVFKSFSSTKTLFYPPWDRPPFAEIIALEEGEAERLKVLWELPSANLITLSIKEFLRKTIPRDLLKENYIYLVPGEKIEREFFLKELVRLGYERVGVVKEKGEFTVKGAVIDVFSPQESSPFRIEFWGDEILYLKSFDPTTQKSLYYLEEVSLLPAKELFFPKESSSLYKRVCQFKEKISEKRLSTLLNYIENKVIGENPDFLLPIFYENLKILPENLPSEKLFFIWFEKSKILKSAELFWEKLSALAYRAKERGKLLFSPKNLFLTLEDLKEFLEKYPSLSVTELPLTEKDFLHLPIEKIRFFTFFSENSNLSSIERGFQILKEKLLEEERIFLFLPQEHLNKVIFDGLRARGIEGLKNLEILKGKLKEGFYDPLNRIFLTSYEELFGRKFFKGREERPKTKVKDYFRRFEDLKPGDYVVHKLHGIGRFLGLIFLKIDGFEGEFLQIEYEGGDKLYVPVFRLEEVYPYVGVEDKPPPLDKLGKQNFLKKRKEIEKSLRNLLEDILKLYAERKAIKSYSIPVDTLSYLKFIETFPFEETPDQEKAIEEILEDLQSSKPMERLLVGDTGFGKTEVALRAVFVTAKAGKQIAFLVPTTILSEQHYKNFKKRLEPFDIKVGILSRLRSKQEQREILLNLAKGTIQVLIGTHRLLSKDVVFKDLGLLIIDEEHRFGVRQKEKLKQLKKSVKVLSLSATPIPRSLQLSLLGIFDLSLIETPPPGRKTIKTFLSSFDSEIIKTGIERELERGGQIFFVHPRIQGLYGIKSFLQKLVPSAKIGVVHGQMDPSLLEKTLLDFLTKNIDILVCTPIIGSGIDIPSANTIFINRADRFGLADIYQLRGRVGRSSEQAYCYLLVPNLKDLNEKAQQRLKPLMRFIELGSGFKLSLNDLKIRGAGELFGINQSGHINKIGYELYLELLENTIRSLRGEEIEDWEPEVNLKISAYIPSNYVPEPEERLSLYRELVLMKNLKELEDFRNLLEDKYGKHPKEVENLIDIYKLKLYLKDLKIFSIEEKGNILVFQIKNLKELPKFPKDFSINNSIKLIKIKEEKTPLGRGFLFFKVQNSLEDSLKICSYLLEKK